MIYGDLDISVLKELPHGRLPVQTFAVTGKLRQRLSFYPAAAGAGTPGYIVCPMIDDRDESRLAGGVQLAGEHPERCVCTVSGGTAPRQNEGGGEGCGHVGIPEP